DHVFTAEELAVDERLGYPEAYAKLCRNRAALGPFCHGPPITFIPYELAQQEDWRGKELDDLFPETDPKSKHTAKPKIFLNLLWKQLNHLGKAGFDPDIIRVDPFGNVVHYHADEGSPLAWEIDHWFPCSRGGLTVPGNLRILQRQVCRRKKNKLEFLIPWWDFQMGISINQFLSIFASSNSDFRRRGFSWLFSDGEYQELHASQTVDCHIFPQHFLEAERKQGMASAALVVCKREPFEAPLKALDFNRRPRSTTPIVGRSEGGGGGPINPYQAIAMARDSLKQRDEEAKMQEEIQRLDHDIEELQRRSEEDKVSIQELEIILMKKRRRAEKCRHLAESQSSYRVMLEKMIRDAMHQNIIYKEQVKLNQAAASALLARLEAQKALCDSAEKELIKKSKQRDELEKKQQQQQEIVPEMTSHHARKRSRTTEDSPPPPETRIEEEEESSPSDRIRSTPHKELRKLLEEEKIECENNSRIAAAPEEEEEENNNPVGEITEETDEAGENEESRRERGRGNIEKWLHFLQESSSSQQEDDTTAAMSLLNIEIIPDESTTKPEHSGKHREKKPEEKAPKRDDKGRRKIIFDINPEGTSSKTSPIREPPYKIISEKTKEQQQQQSSPDDRVRMNRERELLRSESARAFRRIPSSPSVILGGMKRGVDCLGKKPSVLDDNVIDEGSEMPAAEELSRKNFIKSSIKAMKKVI
ncbi:hypothetical protein M569_13319, partial [Genlisea aurea]